MRLRSLTGLVSTMAIMASGIAGAADADPVPLFTSEDLDRMFGPAPAQPRDRVDKTRPEDWRWIQEFLDREYSRIDAERQLDLRSREVDVAARRVDEPARIYGGSPIWGGGYPSLARWNGAGGRYSRWLSRIDRAPCVANRTPPGGGRSNRSGERSK